MGQHLSELVKLGASILSVPAKAAREKHPAKLTRAATPNKGRKPEPRFPNRASWLARCLYDRGWNKHDLARQGGPDHKTTQKVLEGKKIREDALVKIAGALSKKLTQMRMADIPQN
jgi:hypothetical protein